MKKAFLFLLANLFAGFILAQTVAFHENFEQPSLADSVVSSGNPGWALSTTLHNSGLRSDTSKVATNDSTFLTTVAFGTTGYSNVILQFSHICKVEFFDTAAVEVSNDNGVTWTQLTVNQYLGTGFFTNNKFASTSYSDWLPGTPAAVPTNSWWKTEQFDISLLVGNSSQVKIRFKLSDGNGTGSGGNYGWLIDDIKVLASLSELVPPTITLNAPIIQDTVYSTGPFPVSATITDASGILWAKVVYKLNGAPAYDTVAMTNTSGNIWEGNIPSYTFNNKIWYHVVAADNSIAQNIGTNPSSGDKWFYIKQGPTVVVIGNGTSNSGLLPAYGYYNYSWGAQLYKASEINMSGQIDSIAFYVGNTPSAFVMNNQKVFIGHTVAGTYGTSQPDTTTMTVAFSGNMTFTASGWYKIKVQNTFFYNGTSNLLIYWTNRDGSYTSGYPLFNYTPTTDYLGTYKYSDTYSDVFPVSSGIQTYNRPNLRIAFIATNYQEDAGISQIIEPTGIVLAGSPLSVKVTVKNFGAVALTKATINWKLDGVSQTAYNWTGNLLQAVSSLPVTIASQSFTPGSHTIKVWTDLPNDSTDENHLNDTTTASFYACLSILNGTYTIGGGGADFTSFAATLASMQNCGINGPVVFNVNAGTYNEQLTIPEISGASATNTITFQSASGNNADVTLTYNSTASATNYTIKLDGADHFRFRNITIAATNAAYGRVIEVTGNALNNKFEGNKINGISTTSTLSDLALVYSASGTTFSDSLNVFNGNTFLNGSYGMYYYGSSATTLENNTTITNNTFSNQYYAGIYLYYQNAPVISGNTITTNSAYTTFYGIYTAYCDNDLKVLKNKLVIPNGGYGLYVYYSDGTASKTGLIANNFVQIGGTGTAYGFYPYYSTYQNFYYNSVNITSTNTSSGRAMYLYSGCSGIDIKNNILANNGGGYSFYSSITTGVTSNYNDLFTTGTNLGYWTANCTNLAAWQTASSQDASSVSVDPSFTSATDLHVYALQLNAAATPITAVTDDIDGQTRNATTPDIGADEFTPSPIDVAASALVSPPSTGCFGTNQTVKVQIKNIGTDTLFCALHNVTLHSSVTGPNPVTFPDVTLTTDTIISGASKNITASTTYDMSLSGTYIFTANVSVSIDSNQLNDTLAPVAISNNFINTFPYIVDFSGSPSPSWTIQQLNGTGNWAFLTGNMSNPALAPVFGTGMLYFNSYSFSTGVKSRAVTPTLDLTAVNNPKLEFWMSQNADYAANLQEGITVRISVDGGATWTNDTLFVPRYNASFTTPGWKKISKSLAAYTSNLCVRIAFDAYSQAGNSFSLDKVQIFEPPAQEAAMASVLEPIPGCGLGNETVKVKIMNMGSASINGGLTASYKLTGGSSTVTENVPGIILPSDSLNFTFTAPVGLAVTSADSTFEIVSWVDLVGDPIHTNDTAKKNILSGYVPPPPVASNVTIPYGTSATLTATSVDSIFWYSIPAGGSPLICGSNYTTPLLYDTTVYYVEAKPVTPGLEFVVGTGSVTNTQYSYPCPYGQYYNGARQQFLVPASELSAAGMVAGPVESIYFDVVTPILTGLINFTIKLGTTTQNSLTTWVTTGMTTVYSTPLYTTVAGWNEHVLTTPSYTWDGVSNLVVETCFDNYPNGYTDNAVVNQTITSYVSSLDYHSDGGNVCNTGSPPSSTQFSQRPNIKFKATSLGCPSNRTPVTVFVTGIPPYDASVLVIYTPNSGIELTNAEPVKVKIKNYGTSAISNFPVHYKIGINTPITENISTTITPGDTLLYTFTTNADLSSFTTYNIKAFTSLTSDFTYANDTAYKTVINNPIVYCTSMALYSTYVDIGNVTINNLNNGNPLPVTNNTTAVNTYSDFTTLSPVLFTSGVTYPISVSVISLSSFYDTYIKVFIDYNRDAVFDPVTEVVFEGQTTSSQTTITGNVAVPYNAFTNKIIRMRVVAVETTSPSDVQPCGTYNYGETEDYNVIVAPLIPHDAGVIKILQPTSLETEGASLTVKVIVKNFGTDTIFNSSNMYVDYQLNGGTAINTLWNLDTLLPSTTDTIDLPNIIVPPGNNNICAYTVLAGDSNIFNDQTCKAFYGTLLQDAGVTSINQPGAISQSGSSAVVQVTVKNFGANSITNMSVAYQINSGTPVSQSWSGTLNPGTTTIVTLPSFTVPPATFNICSYTILIGDGEYSNDTLCKSSFGIFKDILPYYDNFDGATVAWYDQSTSTDTKWELGTPSYGATNSAHSAPNAWDINLSSGYNSNANSILYTQFFDFSSAVNAKMKFWQNRNTETGWDGTRLEYSINGGTTWYVLGVMNDPNAVNWYTDASINSSSKPAWEGNSNGWQKSEYKLSVLNGQPNVQFRFIFTSDGSVNYDGFSIDDFSITIPQPVDAGVVEIKYPITQTSASSTVHVKVKLQNFGTTTLTSIPVSYKINSSFIVNAVWSGNLAPNDTVSYIFQQTYVSPAGQYNICAYTFLAGDGDHLNDTLCKSVVGIPTFNLSFTDNFEGINYWLSADGMTQWERGIPASSVINSAHSPVNAWKTNLNGDYVANMDDNLYSPIFKLYPSMDSVTLSFWHWYNIASGGDGGRIQYTINGGNTWINLGYIGDPNATSWYTGNINGKHAWTGNSTTWVQSKYKIIKSSIYNNFTTPIQFRFNFFSNASTNLNGWAIDDFSVSVSPIPIDGSVSAILEPSAPTVMAASTTVKVSIKNLGTSALSNIPVFYKVANNAPVSGNWTGTLQPDSTVDYTFASTYNSPVLQYKLCAYTDIANDLYYFNDTSCVFIFPAPPPIDAGIGSIVTPGTSTPAGSVVTVKAKLVNYGTDPLTSVDSVNVNYQVNFGTPTIQLWTGTLPPGDSTDFTFSSIFNAPVSQYNLCVYTTCYDDPNPYNDKYCKNVQTGAGIEESSIDNFILSQNMPNPANNFTTIEYDVPGSGEAIFFVMNSIGQLIYTESKKVDAGRYLVKLDLTNIKAGVYYYTLEFNGGRLYRKMVIVK